MLLFFSDDRRMMMAGRPYPCEVDTILDKIKDIVVNDLQIMDVDSSKHWTAISASDWSDNWITEFKVDEGRTIPLDTKYIIGNRSRLIPDFELIKDGLHSCHYNDLLHSTCYTPKYSIAVDNYQELMTGLKTKFHIGGATPCLKCGHSYAMSGGGDSMLCYDCNEEYENDYAEHCFCCGDRIEEGDGFYIDGELLCPSCIETETFECSECGGTFFNEDLTIVRTEDDRILELCEHCAYERRLEEN
jgi:hypothetical protein